MKQEYAEQVGNGDQSPRILNWTCNKKIKSNRVKADFINSRAKVSVCNIFPTAEELRRYGLGDNVETSVNITADRGKRKLHGFTNIGETSKRNKTNEDMPRNTTGFSGTSDFEDWAREEFIRVGDALNDLRSVCTDLRNHLEELEKSFTVQMNSMADLINLSLNKADAQSREAQETNKPSDGGSDNQCENVPMDKVANGEQGYTQTEQVHMVDSHLGDVTDGQFNDNLCEKLDSAADPEEQVNTVSQDVSALVDKLAADGTQADTIGSLPKDDPKDATVTALNIVQDPLVIRPQSGRDELLNDQSVPLAPLNLDAKFAESSETVAAVTDDGPSFKLGLTQALCSDEMKLTQQFGQWSMFTDEELAAMVIPDPSDGRPRRERKAALSIKSPYTATLVKQRKSKKPKGKKKFMKKHPFVSHPQELEDGVAYNRWRDFYEYDLLSKYHDKEDRAYQKKSEYLGLKPFVFGDTVIDRKTFFYQLVRTGFLLREKHIDIVLYYLRKKLRYEDRSFVNLTTTDSVFHKSLVEYNYQISNVEGDGVALERVYNVLSNYINGKHMLCNVQWTAVDHVLFPIPIEGDMQHWVLGALDIEDWVIYVYDSDRTGDRHDAVVYHAVNLYSFILPRLLHDVGFFGKRQFVRSGEINVERKLILKRVWDVPRQTDNDGGAYVCAFAEYFCLGERVPKEGFNITRYRTRLSMELYNYGYDKTYGGFESDKE